MIEIFRKNIHLFFISFSTFALLSSCDKDLSISLEQNEDKVGVTTIDSMTIHTSTVQLDYLPTHGNGNLLIGKASMSEIGSVTASSYFRVELENYQNEIPEGAEFDSLSLVLKLDTPKYYYGDTTTNQTLYVHRLSEKIERTDISVDAGNYEIPAYVQESSIFSDQKFDYDSAPVGELTFNPKIKTLETLNIRLDDQLGETLFDQIITSDYRMADTESFQEYLKGFVIRPDHDNTTVIGFRDSVEIRINYSYTGSDGFKTSESKKIVTGDRNYQFNNIDYDRSNTDFEDLGISKKEIKSSETNGDTFIQGGTGVVTKIDIPSLHEFMHTPGISVNKAELIVETKNKINGPYPAPETLMLFIANSNNNPISFVTYPFSGNEMQNALYIPGNNTGKDGRYEFDLIEYIKTVNESQNAGKSLMLSAGINRLFNSTNALLIAKENQTPKIKLNIVYTQFE